MNFVIRINGFNYYPEIFKDPATDSGTKKSAKGLLAVRQVDGEYVLEDQCTREYQEENCVMETVFANGTLVRDESLSDIRGRIEEAL